MEIGSLFSDLPPFASINREERNCVAMLYHVLLLHENLNLQEFLGRRGYDWSLDHNYFEVAVEWSFLRDAWHHTRDDQPLHRKVIERGLGLSDGAGGGGAPTVEDFNLYYGAGPRASPQFIQSPATWRLPLLVCPRCRSTWPGNSVSPNLASPRSAVSSQKKGSSSPTCTRPTNERSSSTSTWFTTLPRP
jgi:hypothetical protein